jgi:hypothetical protein
MNFTSEARMNGAAIVGVAMVLIFTALCLAGSLYEPPSREEMLRRWTVVCVAEDGAYGCFEKIVRDHSYPEESRKLRLAELGRQVEPKTILETCSLASKIDCAFHVVDFGVLSWADFNDYTGTWEDFDRRVEQGSHCKRLTCLSDRVPLPDVDWNPA